MDKQNYHVAVAERLIKQLEAGTAPWQRPWKSGQPNAVLPMNPVTGRRYRGINAVHLMSGDHSDQRWLTYKQAQSVNAQVRKGEKGTLVQYWKFTDERTKTDERGNPVLDGNGKPEKIQVRLERPKVFHATVFNAEQIDGELPPVRTAAKNEEAQWNPVERAEAIITASGANIVHRSQDSAYYQPGTDRIVLPEKSQFETADRYYATALHELGHWTGHESRLARDLKHPFGSEGYAREELRAEISSMMLNDELGIGHDPGNHAAYVNHWIKALQKDPYEIFRASADAENIQGYVLAFEQERTQEQHQPQNRQSQGKTSENAERTAPETGKTAHLTQAERAIVSNRVRENLAANTEPTRHRPQMNSRHDKQQSSTRTQEKERER